jgi:hypothetical protein
MNVSSRERRDHGPPRRRDAASSVAHLLGNVAIAAKGPLPTGLHEEARRRFSLGGQ